MAYRVISRLVGLLLLTAAGLKLQGYQLDPGTHLGPFTATWVPLAVVEFEMVLGMWLLSGRCQVGAWITALLTFAVFAGISLDSAGAGEATCGCLGQVTLGPLWVLALDLVVITALFVFRPALPSQPIQAMRAALRPLLAFSLAFAIVLVVGTLSATYAYGSVDAALARLRGDMLTVTPGLVDVGTGSPGEVKGATIEVRNWTDRSIRVIGGTTDCSCVTTHDLPVVLPPGDARLIAISVRLPGKPETVVRQVYLLADDGRVIRIPFRVTGRAM